MIQVAVLYAETKGTYSRLHNVDLWDEERDARDYGGPWPVVAHPPCKRWGRLWRGSFQRNSKRFQLGDDNGCFAAALASVRKWGGVLEHPQYSQAWTVFGISTPDPKGGWSLADTAGGYTCEVYQCHYGHETPKPTWLYAYRVHLPSLTWGPGYAPKRITTARKPRAITQSVPFPFDLPDRISKPELKRSTRSTTPAPFRDLLLDIAQTPAATPATLFDNGSKRP